MSNLVELEQVSKRFGDLQAVAGVTFQVAPGEIFGLLGPNGAGKTTTIRLMLDILRPDSGRIAILGGAMSEAKKAHIGYLPEERGLYAGLKLWDVVLYLGTLKGLSRREAARRAERYLRRLDLWPHRHKKLSELSRGMHQKAQFVVTVLHDPELLIVDEPFAGLDPVNTALLTRMIREMQAEGKGIIMSTHQMHQVEALCDRIVLIHRGRIQLDGSVMEIRRRFAGNTVRLRGSDALAEVAASPAVSHAERRDGEWSFTLSEATTAQAFWRSLAARPDLDLYHFSLALPGLDEIFIQVVGDPEAEQPVDA